MSGWYRQMRDVHALLTGPDASVRLVLTPERVVIAEARRTWTSLGLYGFAVDGVVVNRVIPAAAAPWRRLAALVERGAARRPDRGGRVVRRAPDRASALPGRRADRHRRAGRPGGAHRGRRDDRRTTRSACSDRSAHDGLRVRRSGSGYVLSLPLPLVHAREVDLKRRDAELLVSVGDHRRVLSLPAVAPAVCRPRRPRPGGDAAGDVRAGPRPLAGPGGRPGTTERTTGCERPRMADETAGPERDRPPVGRSVRWPRRRRGCWTRCWRGRPEPGSRAGTHTRAPEAAGPRAGRRALPDLRSRAGGGARDGARTARSATSVPYASCCGSCARSAPRPSTGWPTSPRR